LVWFLPIKEEHHDLASLDEQTVTQTPEIIKNKPQNDTDVAAQPNHKTNIASELRRDGADDSESVRDVNALNNLIERIHNESPISEQSLDLAKQLIMTSQEARVVFGELLLDTNIDRTSAVLISRLLVTSAKDEAIESVFTATLHYFDQKNSEHSTNLLFTLHDLNTYETLNPLVNRLLGVNKEQNTVSEIERQISESVENIIMKFPNKERTGEHLVQQYNESSSDQREVLSQIIMRHPEALGSLIQVRDEAGYNDEALELMERLAQLPSPRVVTELIQLAGNIQVSDSTIRQLLATHINKNSSEITAILLNDIFTDDGRYSSDQRDIAQLALTEL